MPDFSFGDGKPPSPKAMIFAAIGLLVLILIGAGLLTERAGIFEISEREVGVIVNYMTGEDELVNQPGYRIFIPLLEQAFKFDKSPNEFVMEGSSDRDSNHVKKLTVRANDGSNFWFETLKIQYQLLPSHATYLLHDSGEGESFKQNWVRAYARSILRDEFGRYSAEEVADPSGYKTATAEAKRRLNEALRPHGVEIFKIITPKPKFEATYEKAIEDRKVANQQVEKLKIEANQLLKERDRRLANIERDKATEYELLLGTLEADRISAEKDAVQVSMSADAWAITQRGAGQAEKDALLAQARGLETQARKEAEGLRARVEALAERGDILVRETLARKLASISFEIIPYRRDPAPVRLEHLGAAQPVAGGQR
jgi:membrane protease subunit HflC